MRAVVVHRHNPLALGILADHRLIDVDPGTPLRLRTRHVCRLHEAAKPVHRVWRGAAGKTTLRSQNDKNKRIALEGFETPEMKSPQEGQCEHSWR